MIHPLFEVRTGPSFSKGAPDSALADLQLTLVVNDASSGDFRLILAAVLADRSRLDRYIHSIISLCQGRRG